MKMRFRLPKFAILFLLVGVAMLATQLASKTAVATTANDPEIEHATLSKSLLLQEQTWEENSSLFHLSIGPTTLRGKTLAAKKNLESSTEAGGLANCRYGVNSLRVGPNFDQIEVIPDLGAGWYVTYNSRTPNVEPTNGAEFYHMIHVNQVKDNNGDYLPFYTTRPDIDSSLSNYISQNPGEIWIIGNEYERKGQGETHAQIFAEAYYDIYHFVKVSDPTARVAIGGLVQYTPGRVQYLDMMWQAYINKYRTTMPIDIWTMHLYILPEVENDGVTPNNIAGVALGTEPTLGKRVSNLTAISCANDDIYCYAEHDDMSIFNTQMRTLRQWMQEHGEQNKPLLLTEFSILYPYEIDSSESCFLQDEFGNCFTPQRVSTYMQNVFHYLQNTKDPAIGYPMDDNRLVQQWAWFSVYSDGVGDASNLYHEDITTPTQVGISMRDYIWDEPIYKDLIVQETSTVIAFTGTQATTSAELSVSFRNKGNVAVDQPFNVTFYANSSLTQPIGTVTISPPLSGCAVEELTAKINWSGLTPGVHDYWAFVDSNNVIVENPGTNNNNIGMGRVIVDPEQLMLPTIMYK